MREGQGAGLRAHCGPAGLSGGGHLFVSHWQPLDFDLIHLLLEFSLFSTSFPIINYWLFTISRSPHLQFMNLPTLLIPPTSHILKGRPFLTFLKFFSTQPLKSAYFQPQMRLNPHLPSTQILLLLLFLVCSTAKRLPQIYWNSTNPL